jgi:N6-L-threonylcarbamoyladenine synthase
VAANGGLRAALEAASRTDGFSLHVPAPRFCTDNAAMIAAEASTLLACGRVDGLDLGVDPGLPVAGAA